MKKRKILVPALLAIAMSGSLIAGATYSLFTSTSSHDITVSSGKVALESTIDEASLKLGSIGIDKIEGTDFPNGGTAAFQDNILVLDKVTPGDKVTFNINLKNYSTVKINYRITLRCKSGAELFSALVITPDINSGWKELQPEQDPNSPKTEVKTVTVSLPQTAGDEYQGLNTAITINVEAVQANGKDKYNPSTIEFDKVEDQVSAAKMTHVLKSSKPSTMKEAVDTLKKNDPSYDLETITPKYPETNFVYNLKDNKVNAVLREDLITATADANNWVIVETEDVLNNLTEKYSVYLASNFEESGDNILTVTNGIDMGENNEAYTIKYTGETAKKELLFNTSGAKTNLEITAFESGENSDTIKHYGEVGKVSLINAGSHSYHEFGVTAYVELTKGRLVAEEKAKIEVVYAKGDDLVVSKVDTATITKALTVTSTNVNGNVSLETTTEEAITQAGADAIKDAKSKVVKVTKADGSSDMLKMDEFRAEWNKGTYYNLENPATVELNDNVDLSNYPQWGPIGSWQYPFNGTFDGKGFTIDNLTGVAGDGVDANGNHIGHGEVYGFFGIVGGADCTIKNVNFDHVNINIPDVGKNVGTVVGYVPDNGKYVEDGNTYLPVEAEKYTPGNTMGSHNLTIDHVNVGTINDNSKVVANVHVGGFVGKYYSSGALNISNCKNYANVTSNGHAGGFIAYPAKTASSMTFNNIENNGDIQGNGTCGGIAAYVSGANTSFINCTNNGNVKGTKSNDSSISGILGWSQAGVTTLVFDNCTNNGNITGTTASVSVSGIFGGIYGYSGNPNIYFKHKIINSGKINSVPDSKLTGEIIGAYSFKETYGSITEIKNLEKIDVNELDPSITFIMTNRVNRGNGSSTVSVNVAA